MERIQLVYLETYPVLENQNIIKKIGYAIYSVERSNPIFREATSDITIQDIERINNSSTDSQSTL